MLLTKVAWTPHDTAICVRAEASGMALSAKTGEPLTLQELRALTLQFDKVRSITTVDEFLKGKVNSKPFVF